MKMRVFIAGLLGGIVFFAWGAIAHMALPIGQMGMREAKAEDPVIAALRDNLPGEGVYMVPGLSPEQMKDEAAVKAYSQKAKSNPNAFIVYQPVGRDGMDMGAQLGIQAATDILSAMVVAWVLSLGALGFGQRVAASAGLGLFSWLTVSAPYWNWYRFTDAFSVGNLLEQVIGWLIAGVAIAWWLGRGQR
jgi:hypothetical protein